MIDWGDKLIEAIARRRCVIVIGAGVSRNSVNSNGKRPATWEEFLNNCADEIQDDECIRSLLERKDFLTACEVIKDKISHDGLIDKVQREYQREGYKTADIHRHVYNLDASIVATPNFDNIYETHARVISSGTVIVKDHTSADIANYFHGGDNRLILKTHGSADDPQNVIFTRKDYAEARTKYVLFYEILKSLALTHTFLFLGCGTDDPDIRTIFEDIQFAHNRMPFHYMTLPEGEVSNDVLRIISNSMRIKFCNYSPNEGHLELTESLAELVSKVEDYRSENLSKTLKW